MNLRKYINKTCFTGIIFLLISQCNDSIASMSMSFFRDLNKNFRIRESFEVAKSLVNHKFTSSTGNISLTSDCITMEDPFSSYNEVCGNGLGFYQSYGNWVYGEPK